MKKQWAAAIALILLAPLLGACARQVAASGPGGSGRVRLVQEEDMDGGAYIEGYVASARVTRPDGSPMFEITLPYKEPVLRDLRPGSYRLAFSVRPCDANCGNLDGVSERCEASFRIEPARVTDLHAVVRPDAGCRITPG
jgi:hypothetical protein